MSDKTELAKKQALVDEMRTVSKEQLAYAVLLALQRKVTELEALAETMKNEAQIHAMEAKTANATINEVNQFISGATGEPANWHGAQPVKDFVNALKAQLADAKKDAARWQAVKPMFRTMSANIDGNHTWTLAYHGSLKGASMDDAADKVIQAEGKA